MKIGIGSDHNGFEFKEEIKEFLEGTEHEIVDFGCYSKDAIDYPGVAKKVAVAVSEKEIDRAILICGTGIGVAITANKVPGVRAAQAHDTYSAERAQLSNNAQIITLGAQVIGHETGKKVVEAFLNVEWAEGSKRKVDQIIDIEKSYSK